MTTRAVLAVLILLGGLLGSRQAGAAGGLSIVQVQPGLNGMGISPTATLSVLFDRPVERATIHAGSFAAFGRWSGPVTGSYSFAEGDQRVTLTPDQPFSAGEQVMVVLSAGIAATDGTRLARGYSSLFGVQVSPGGAEFTTIDVLPTRSQPDQPTRSYGGVATDLNNDGWLDLSIVNEDTADVRVFLNRADGTGLFHDFLPPNPVNQQASPSEPGDFNGDGNADLAVANIATNSVSVLLGQGDGAFAPQQEIPVGPAPRGIVVLDADSDGDADVVNTNSGGGGTLSLLLNDGMGHFGAPTFFEGGGTGEWALGVADMNEDGLLDLVTGTQSGVGSLLLVLAGQGDGTFSPLASQAMPAGSWMLNTGDVNGDGHADVAVVHNATDSGSIFLGDGTGQLAAPTTLPTDPFPLATDLGDLDGDGDLDWMTSSFFGDWNWFANDGQGNFVFRQGFPASAAASCSLMLDFDNDGDLDLALIDEIADEVTLVRNGSAPTALTLSDLAATPRRPAARAVWLGAALGLVAPLALASWWRGRSRPEPETSG